MVFNSFNKYSSETSESNVYFEDDITIINDKLIVPGRSKAINRLFRYTPFQFLYQSLTSNTLYFSSPESWDDPFEKEFFKCFTRHSVFCICFNKEHSENEEAAWSLYASRSNATPTIRYSIDIIALIKALNNYSIVNGDVKFYLGVCDYSKDRRQLQNINKFIKANVSSLTLEEKLYLMLFKRKSYKFENEIRLFAVLPKSSHNHFILDLNSIGYDLKSLIGRVTLPPLPIDGKLNNKEYTDLQIIVNGGMREYLQGFLNASNNRVDNCGLYRLY